MSYDLEVWSVRPLDATAFRHPERWRHPVPTQWIQEGKSWQISVFQSNKVLAEDVPEEIGGLLPGIQCLTELHLEGKATNEAVRLLQSASSDIAKALHGVVLDQQEGTTKTPAGVKRFIPPKKQETFSVLSLSWWFLGDPLLSHSGRESFIALLERLLPEALPKRYGQYEPPQHVYAETGKTHLIQYLDDHAHDHIVWYPHRPVTSVHLNQPKSVGASKLGYRTNLLKIEIESATLLQAGWAQSLHLFWRQVSRMLRPIYGDVRTLGGRHRRGTTIYIRADNAAGGEIPQLTKSWWWRGIPKKLGCAVVLGEDYQRVWPAFLSKAALEDGLAFASVADWTSATDLSEVIGTPPDTLVMRPQATHQTKQEYPRVWPFGPQFVSQDFIAESR